jgi:hypothetical protein
VLMIVDDRAHDIDRGKIVPDERFFAPFLNGATIREIRRIPVRHDGQKRWKLFEIEQETKA